MDPNIPAPPASPLRPMNEPHTPISESEMNPNPGSSSKSSKSTLLTLASILILAGVVGITFWLYIKNTTTKTPLLANNNKETENKNTITPTPNFEKKPEQLLNDYGVVCKRFTSLKEALQNPEIACVIDLSGQKLTEVPKELFELKNITQLDLADNNLSKFPAELLSLKKLAILDLRNNNITSFETKNLPEKLNRIPTLNNILLDGNSLDKNSKNTIDEYFGKLVKITY